MTKIIIHTFGPVYHDGQHGELEKLAVCYRNSLVLAVEHGCKYIVFPCISMGVYGYPIEDAAKIAVEEMGAFLFPTETKCALAAGIELPERSEFEGPQGAARRSEEEMEVIFCCFSGRDKAIYDSILERRAT